MSAILQIVQQNHEIVLSIVAGFIVSAIIITVSGEQKPSKASKRIEKTKTDTTTSPKKKQQSEEGENDKDATSLPSPKEKEEATFTPSKINTDGVNVEVTNQLKKSPRLRKFFGVKNDQNIEEEVKKIEQVSKKVPQKYEPEEDISDNFEEAVLPILTLFFYAAATAVALYLGNMATNGLFFQVFVGLFPKEAKTLKIV